MKTKKLVLILLFLMMPSIIFGQSFGKNKVQYKNFTWYYIQSKHFDVYFYDENEYIASFVADAAESLYVDISKSLRYELQMRVPIIVYSSHNEWQQNNVLPIYMEEGYLGVTELFKNRVMFPFEGIYENFRHTLKHEVLHAFVYDYIYGGSAASVISGRVRIALPDWYHEGLAEYEAEGWSTNADMIIRDATINGTLNYTTPYKTGQALHNYIVEKYGKQKTGEILGKIKLTHDIDKGFRASLGIGVEKLVENWQRYLKRRYWPEIADRRMPDEIAKKLTDHVEMKCYYNVSPALSPNGDKIAFISDKDGYYSVFILSTIDGKIIDKVITGQKNAIFEELHILSPGLSWSPDGSKIALSAKGGNKDYLYIIDIYTKEVDQKDINLDGVFDASWSPDGNYIAFTGTKNGASDIYLYDLIENKKIKITDDPFSDIQPSWSPDGQKLLFASDRKDFVEGDFSEFKMQFHDYKTMDIYSINKDGTGMKRITSDFMDQKDPIWSPDGKIIAYTSDQNGIANIYFYDIEKDTSFAVTNTLTGFDHLSWSTDGNKLVFGALNRGGYDIFMIKNPYKLKDNPVKLSDTKYMAELRIEQNNKSKEIIAEAKEPEDKDRKFAGYIFDPNIRKLRGKPSKNRTAEHLLQEEDYKTSAGEYKINKYKLKFSTDVVTGNAGVDTYYGLQGLTQVQISDILGNHKIQFVSNLFYDLKNSDFYLTYYYLPKKIDYGFGISNEVYHFYYPLLGYDPYLGYYYNYFSMRLRKFAGTIYMLRPFSKYTRLEYMIEGSKISREFTDPTVNYPAEYVNAMRNILIYTKDTVLWGMTGPIDGSRYSFELTYSPKIGKNGLDFTMVNFDYRKYFRMKRDYTFAVRLSGGSCNGSLTNPFFLGGVPMWFNRKFRGGVRMEVDDIFFSKFIMPLRGSYYYEKVGNRYGLMNLEFRFPMIRYLSWAWPLSINLYDVKGAIFYDVGSAWNDDNFRGTVDGRFKDLVSGYGFGTRINLNNIVLFRMDVAWKFDLVRSSKKPMYYFSLGLDY